MSTPRFHECWTRIGTDHSGLAQFSGIMDLPPPIILRVFDNIQRTDKSSLWGSPSKYDGDHKQEINLKKELESIHQENNKLYKLKIKCDGRRQKREYKSLNSPVLLIDTET